MFCRHAYVYTMYRSCAHGSQKRAQESLGQELQMVVNFSVGVGNCAQVLSKSNSAPNQLSSPEKVLQMVFSSIF